MLSVGPPGHHRVRVVPGQGSQIVQNVRDKALEHPVDFFCNVELGGLLDILGGNAVVHVFCALPAAGLHQHLHEWHEAVAHPGLDTIHLFQVQILKADGGDILCRLPGNESLLRLGQGQSGLHLQPGPVLFRLTEQRLDPPVVQFTFRII